jgi:large subunit ribosomal protein L24
MKSSTLKLKIKKGDTVKVLQGKDRGKTGTVLHAHPEIQKVTVEGLNMAKKRMRPRKQNEKGQTVSIARPLPIGNVALVCKSCGKATKVGYRIEGTEKYRVCRKCDARV